MQGAFFFNPCMKVLCFKASYFARITVMFVVSP